MLQNFLIIHTPGNTHGNSATFQLCLGAKDSEFRLWARGVLAGNTVVVAHQILREYNFDVASSTPERQLHWDGVYGRRAPDELSWFEGRPTHSLEMIDAGAVDRLCAVIDVGGGASTLVDELIARGYSDLTVLDISEKVLANVSTRLGEQRRHVTLIQQDITTFQPNRKYALWHDRAVFHFLTSAADRERYRQGLLAATLPGSQVIIATFGPEGPTRCSGLDTMRYDARTLASEFGADLELTASSIEIHPTPAGAQQQFLYAHFERR